MMETLQATSPELPPDLGSNRRRQTGRQQTNHSIEFPDDATATTLLPCITCNRTFNPQALDRHTKVCEKLSSKRRKIFNSTKQRVDGMDVTPSRTKSPERKTTPPKNKSKWREKHQEFLRAIRAAKNMPSDDGDSAAPISTIPSDYLRCPYCERHFGPKAADRHIEWCREKSTRMPRSPASNQAVERLKSRTKYVPPKPGQNGWRAPKKSDVISSIPPPSSGPTPTPLPLPPGIRELSPTNTHRQLSPTRSLGRHASPPLPAGRHMSPPPVNSSRRTSTSSVASLGRSGSMSLGRSAGRSLSQLLKSAPSADDQSVTGCSSGYGSSSGYGQSSRYGQSSGYRQSPNYGLSSGYGESSGYDESAGYGQPQGYGLSRVQVGRSSFNAGSTGSLNRQGSVRSSLRRQSSHNTMARHRDLASDMMASVCISGNPKRGEPEGDEADQTPASCSSSHEANFSNKVEKEKMNQIKKKVHRTDYIAKEKFDRIIESPVNSAIEEEDTKCERTVNPSEENRNYKNTNANDKKATWNEGENRNNFDQNGYNANENNNVFISNTKHNNNDCQDESDNEILDELQYNYDSEEEIDIPTEENFLKSSTSISGDDDLVETAFGRPRSVHFEDEKWEDGEYRLKNGNETQYSNTWNEKNPVKLVVYPNKKTNRYVEEDPELPFSGQGRLSNIKSANKESVRELLRRRREEAGESVEQDSRRRVASIERKLENGTNSLENDRRQSRSKDRTIQQIRNSDRNSNERNRNTSVINNNASVHSEKKQHMSRSRSPKKNNGYSKNVITLMPVNADQSNAGVVISQRDYAMFKSLVDSQSGGADKFEKDIRKAVVKGKQCPPSRSSSQKRLGEAPYDPFSAAELQMQTLMGPSKSSSRKGSGLGNTGLGKGVSLTDLIRLEGTGRESPDFEFSIGFSEAGKSGSSSRDRSPEQDFDKCSTVGNGLSAMGSNLTELGSPLLKRSSESNWPWHTSSNTISDRISIGLASPTFRKPSWSSRETIQESPTREKDTLQWPSTAQNTDLQDSSRWSTTTRVTPSRESSTWSSALRDSPTRETRSWSSPTRDSPKDVSSQGGHSWSRDNSNWSSLNNECRSWSSPVRDTRSTSSPNRDDRSWSSPTRETRSVSSSDRDTYRVSSPVRSISSPTRDTPNPTPSTATTKSTTKRWGDSSNSTTSSGWGGDSSGIGSLSSSFNRYLGSGSTGTRDQSSKVSERVPYNNSITNNGFETYRANHTTVGAENDPAKKTFPSVEDPHQRVSSGSSSDSSLPPLSSSNSSASQAGTNKGDGSSASSSMRMPRFCHECGHKYPVLLAKFCCQCGSRRLSVDN